MQIHDLVQGSAEWRQYRLEKFGASEAAAMLGISTLVKRNELLHMKATGTAQEFSDWVQKHILDYGHHVEALARPLVEEMIGEDLYPVTCSDGRISASCDGLTLGEEIAFEHKQWNQALAEAIAAGQLPDEYMPQPQQIMMVTPAKKVIFVCSDGTRDNFVYLWVLPDPAWQARIRDGWTQFEADLAEYQHVEVLPPAVAAAVQDLPALSIRVDGQLTLNHNLVLFGARLQSFIADIDTNPSDDQAFADAEQAIKVMERAETALDAAKASALGQISTVDEMVRTVASYHELARKTRLMLEKVVKARKETIRVEIQQAGKDKVAAHIAALNTRLGKPYMPAIAVDFAGVMKGKKTVTSLRDAVDTELARFKIEANAVADRIQVNLTTLRELAANHAFLFADTASIVLKDADDLTALVKLRIAEHEKAEAAKAEALREKIRVEEAARIEREQREAQESEDLLIASVWNAARRIEFDSVPYIEKAIRTFESAAKDWANDPRPRVAAAIATARNEMSGKLAAAAERARVAAETKRQLDDQAANLAAARAQQAAAEQAAAQAQTAPQNIPEIIPEPAPAAQVTPIDAARAPAPADEAMIRLGQINERLAPIALTADGLAQLGFAHVTTDKSAKLYRESDFQRICAALIRHVDRISQQAKAA